MSPFGHSAESRSVRHFGEGSERFRRSSGHLGLGFRCVGQDRSRPLPPWRVGPSAVRRVRCGVPPLPGRAPGRRTARLAGHVPEQAGSRLARSARRSADTNRDNPDRRVRLSFLGRTGPPRAGLHGCAIDAKPAAEPARWSAATGCPRRRRRRSPSSSANSAPLSCRTAAVPTWKWCSRSATPPRPRGRAAATPRVPPRVGRDGSPRSAAARSGPGPGKRLQCGRQAGGVRADLAVDR